MAPWWWFPCKPKHVGAVLLILKCFNNSTFFNVVCVSWKLKCWILLIHGVTMKFIDFNVIYLVTALDNHCLRDPNRQVQTVCCLRGTWTAYIRVWAPQTAYFFLYILLTVMIPGKWLTWRTILFYVFISILYMFRATSCSSSGESIVSIQHLPVPVAARSKA